MSANRNSNVDTVKDHFESYFSVESGFGTRCFYFALLGLTVLYSTASILSPLLVPECDLPDTRPRLMPPSRRVLGQGTEGGMEDAPNPSYHDDPCAHYRYVVLLGMTKWETDMTRRLVMSILMGSIIGFERRRPDRPAGIRTMAMVCLGSCVFTLGSMFAFVDGTMGWDASRVSAAIPSGVGFLGAASIWKGTKGTGSASVTEVHGLTTATSVWLSAAIGILCGGGLYVPGLFTTSAGVVYLRFAPRLDTPIDTEEDADDADDDVEAGAELRTPLNPSGAAGVGASCVGTPTGASSKDSRRSIERADSKGITKASQQPSIHA